MSTLASEAFEISITGNITSGGTTLMPRATRVDPRIDVNPLSVILAVSIVFILAPITISSNSMILAAFYRYKRLRTASNCLLASLAVSDFGVGVFMPFGVHLELSGLPDNVEVSTVCTVPYCIVITLCSVSVLVTVAIAVDRLTSLAQPLRYKNIITHSSVEKYIAVFWLYSIGVGLSPLIYTHVMGLAQSHSASCRFGTAVRPPVRVFLVIAVWAPSALVLLGCYMYVYLVARAHARAIYTVELSFRNQTQTMALPRYGQTLAVTVGAFLILWLPFQACMLLDIFCGTKLLSEWAVVWLGLPILSHSAANPWIYAFHHGEMRVAATKIAEDVVTRFGIHPSRYGCSPIRRGSNTNYELAEVNKSNETRPPPVEDCFAAKHLTILYQREKAKCPSAEFVSSDTDISPEGVEHRGRFPAEGLSADIVEEDIRDLANMLKPEYAIDRNHLIDSNHNIDKFKHFKHLLDPTLYKIRNFKCLNQKVTCAKTATRCDEARFISYQNLKSDVDPDGKIRQFNAISDPTLHADDITTTEPKNDVSDIFPDDSASFYPRRNSNLSSMSDPNLKVTHGNSSGGKVFGGARDSPRDFHLDDDRGRSVRSLQHEGSSAIVATRSTLQCRRVDKLKKSGDPRSGTKILKNFELSGFFRDTKNRRVDGPLESEAWNDGWRCTNKQITLTSNKLANFCNANHRGARKGPDTTSAPARSEATGRQDFMTHSGSISTIERACRHSRLSNSSRFGGNLAVPTVHSEPPSPIEPLPRQSSAERESSRMFSHQQNHTLYGPAMGNPWHPQLLPSKTREMRETPAASPSTVSNLTIPYVLLNFDDNDSYDIERKIGSNLAEKRVNVISAVPEPEELATAILLSSAKRHQERRTSDARFPEHDSTRFSSRRPSDLRWSESSRSQEILSNVNEHQKSPSSYSVNNFQSCTSGSDFNDVTCLGSFVCPDALTSSLRESLFETPSVPNSDVFTSFEDLEAHPDPLSFAVNDDETSSATPMVHCSVSSANLERTKISSNPDNDQSKSSESLPKNQRQRRNRAVPRQEGSIYRSRPRTRPGNDCAIGRQSSFRKNSRLAPLATATPMDICTPTYDTTAEIKGSTGVGVRV